MPETLVILPPQPELTPDEQNDLLWELGHVLEALARSAIHLQRWTRTHQIVAERVPTGYLITISRRPWTPRSEPVPTEPPDAA